MIKREKGRFFVFLPDEHVRLPASSPLLSESNDFICDRARSVYSPEAVRQTERIYNVCISIVPPRLAPRDNGPGL